MTIASYFMPLNADLITSGTDGLDAQKRAQQGFDMVSIITDVGVLAQAMLQQLDVAKGKGQEQSKSRDGY